MSEPITILPEGAPDDWPQRIEVHSTSDGYVVLRFWTADTPISLDPADAYRLANAITTMADAAARTRRGADNA